MSDMNDPCVYKIESYRCTECDWHDYGRSYLSAKNPFDASEEISGCPKCKSINTIVDVCEFDGCWRAASCGTPTPEGYRRTCGKHVPV